MSDEDKDWGALDNGMSDDSLAENSTPDAGMLDGWIIFASVPGGVSLFLV